MRPRDSKLGILAVVVATFMVGCVCLCGREESRTPSSAFQGDVEQWFGAETWREAAGFRADIEVEFRGNRVLAGKVAFDPDAARTRFDLEDGTVVVFDGERCWVAGGELGRARFHALTWPYFVALPAKLGDPGSTLRIEAPTPWFGEKLASARLTFGPSVGDAPDDWYVVAMEPESGALVGAAYIVTYGGKDGDEEPHAVHYRDVVEVGGTRISTRATFYNWSSEKGPHGDPIGEYRLANPQLVETFAPGTFARPDGSTEAPLPGGS